MCTDCFEKKKESWTVFTAKSNGNTVMIKNVPCLECETCGEKYFSEEVSAQLEAIVKESGKCSSKEIIVEYDDKTGE